MSSLQLVRREKILHFCLHNPGLAKKEIAKQLEVPLRTIYSVLKTFQERQTLNRKPGSARPRGCTKPELVQKVKLSIQRNPTISIRTLAEKYGTSIGMIQRIKKQLQYRSYKKKKIARREEKQDNKAIRRSKKLYRMLCAQKQCLVMDDETYCASRPQVLPGHQYYSALDRKWVPSKYKYITLEKFGKKYLVWQAICECGKKSTPFFTQGTINSEIYIKECLQKRLLPFIKAHRGPTIFWPDLAPAHYSGLTKEWYNQNQVQVVPKEWNPPNVPELRPIERFWALAKAKFKKTSCEAKNLQQFKGKWNRATSKLPKDTVQRLMMKVKSKVRNFSRRRLNQIPNIGNN